MASTDTGNAAAPDAQQTTEMPSTERPKTPTFKQRVRAARKAKGLPVSDSESEPEEPEEGKWHIHHCEGGGRSFAYSW